MGSVLAFCATPQVRAYVIMLHGAEEVIAAQLQENRLQFSGAVGMHTSM